MLARIFACVTVVATMLLHTAVVTAQLQHATVTAIVVDARFTPMAGATVRLSDALGAELRTATTDRTGRAAFEGISPGRYALTTDTGTSPLIQVPLTVTAALPVEVTVRVPAALSDRVVVEGITEPTSARGSLAAASIARVPTRLRARGLHDVIATLPGWATEDNGLLHARGVDDGFLYVIDGVPVYERLDAVSGLAPDVGAIGSIDVITGYVPPEYGYKAGGVIEIRSAVAHEWSASADAALGNDAAREVSGALGGALGERVGVRVGGSAAASDRYLDPVHPDNFHNTGGQRHLHGQTEWGASPADRVSFGWGIGRAAFDVPNNAAQEEAGQDQQQRIGQGFVNASWQRTWSADLVTQAALYVRRTSARIDGSPFDTPLEAHGDRTLRRTGSLFAVTRQFDAHVVKSGLEWQRLSLAEAFSFAITDREAAEEAEFRGEALVFTPERPFAFRGRARPTLFSAYVQDTWQAAARLTLSGGVRFDRAALLLPRTQWSPRVGAALRVNDDTAVRASVSRYFQPPQPENLLLSSSPEARVLSGIVVDGAEGGADIEPERQWGSEIGVAHRVGRARLDLAYWRRTITNVADPNVFAATTVIFPNAVARGRGQGVEMRVEVPRTRGWSGYANAAVARVVQTGPINGGLFLEDDVEEIGPGVEFTPDHDQRVTAGAGLIWEPAAMPVTLSLVARYETGTPTPFDEDDLDELARLPGAHLVDVERGRVKPRTVVSVLATAPLLRRAGLTAVLGVQVLNLLDAQYAYNFGNPFSGTHFGAPRTMAASVKLQFR